MARFTHLSFDENTFCTQVQSPLFNSIPAEIRNRIYHYALSPYSDLTRSFDEDTCYKRPDYAAPSRSDTALLRTCQRIYREAWHVPWTSAEHTLWLTWEGRCPRKTLNVEALRSALKAVHDHHDEEVIELQHIRIFAQLCKLEPGVEISRVLRSPHFHPRRITLTIRHTDWWEWESDYTIRLLSQWAKSCILPSSLRQLTMELETLQRKQTQVDFIAAGISASWFFKRLDGVSMAAQNIEPTVTKWSGSSTWEGRRWIRDEVTPDILDYVVASVTFQPVDDQVISSMPRMNDICPPEAAPMNSIRSYDVRTLQEAGVKPGMGLVEIQGLVENRALVEWRNMQARRSDRRRRLP